MSFWIAFVDVIRFALFATAHVLGGSIGAGIFAFSLAVRVAMLPLTIAAARRMREQQAKLRQLKPQLDAITKRFKTDPLRAREATMALYREHGISATPSLKLAFAQWPLGAGIFAAVRSGVARNTRFLWIDDLTKPDLGLALTASLISAAVARLAGGDNSRVAMAVGATLTFVFAWRMSASIALYSIAWSGVSALESLGLSIAERRKLRSVST
jgi:YidC/Oxa1 family membrane protein insertase